MYKMTFDDKPEANTYVKWARGHGYQVGEPVREKLPNNVKKFDLNGKRKKYRYYVLRKRGAGREGGDPAYMSIPEKTKWKEKQIREEMAAKGIRISDANIRKMAEQWAEGRQSTVTTLGGGLAPAKAKAQAKVVAKEDRDAQLKLWWGGASQQEKTRLATSAGFRGNVGLKGVSELTPEQVMRMADKKEERKGKEPVFLMKTPAEADAARKRLVAEGYKHAVVKVKHVGDDEGAGIQGYYTEPGEKEELKGEPTIIKQKAGAPRTKKTKDAAEALRASLEQKRPVGRPKGSGKKQKPVIAEPVYAKPPASDVRPEIARALTQEDIHERLVSDAEKLFKGGKASEPKKRGRPPKAKEGAVAVAEKPPERRSFESGRFAAPPELKRAAYRSSPEIISKASAARGIGLTPEQIKESQRKAQEVIREKAREIAKEPERKPTAVETVAEEWKARGEIPSEQVDIMARVAERERARKEEAEREAKYIETLGEPLTPGQKRRYEEVRAMKREIEAPEKARTKLIEDTAKARRAEDIRTAREAKRSAKAAKKAAARQESARKYVIRQYLKEGRQLPTGVSDYVAEKEKFQVEKAAAIGRRKAARIETAKQARKYQETVRPEEGKWTYAEAQAKAKEMETEKEPGREIRIGKRAIWRGTEKRKTYILRGRKPGEFKVVAGTKKELEAPRTIKAALAQEKRKYKKRKKLLEKPLREIKRAKRVLRTSARHGAKQLLRRSGSFQRLTRGKHPAVGNVSMEYHAAKISGMPLVPRSVAGVYTIGEDERRRR